MTLKDYSTLLHINEFCLDIEDAVNRFGNDFSVFKNDKHYKNSVFLCIAQIGELVSLLSDDYRVKTKGHINWAAIKATRNVCIHSYGKVDLTTIWETIKIDIPTLKTFCEAEISRYEKDCPEILEAYTD